MGLWFSEIFGDIQGAWRVKQVLYQRRSQFQEIMVLDTVPFGRMLVLDGCVMTTEKDECAYHEMLTHIGLLAHPHPERVCVVGGGDGGTVREVLKHDSVKEVVLAEIDPDVIEVCREFMPSLAGTLDDPRVTLAIGDGAQYLAEHSSEFDAVFSDSTDPIGPGAILFADSYFQSAKHSLREGGVFVTQCKSLWTDAAAVKAVAQQLGSLFRTVLPYGATIPTYPTGSWSFVFASDKIDPRVKVHLSRQESITKSTRYYTKEHQTAAFAMPAFYNQV